jgi:arginine repressor
MTQRTKITEFELLQYLREVLEGRGKWRLPGSLKLGEFSEWGRSWGRRDIDAVVEIGWEGEEWHLFVIEAKARNTPEAIETATAQAQTAATAALWPNRNPHPMIFVPYLSKERLDELEQRGVSGIDACGNAMVLVPGKLYVRRDGNPNQYRNDRDLSNPFSGLSAMVGRTLLLQREFKSLNDLHRSINQKGASISLSQVSKAIKALTEERLVHKTSKGIRLRDPLRLLDQLALGWKPPADAPTHACNLKPGTPLAEILESLVIQMPDGPICRWSITGESSVERYASFSQHGPRKIAVSNLLGTLQKLHPYMTTATTRNFAEVIFIQTIESGYYFHNEVDDQKFRWADPLQTWLELQAGDARQRTVARDLRELILKKTDYGNDT